MVLGLDFEAFLFIAVVGTLPLHALIMMWFLNRRAFRAKKRQLHDWLAAKGIVSERISRAERARQRERAEREGE